MNFTARLFLLVSLLCGSTAIAEVCQLYPIAISEEITQSAQEGDVFHRVPTGSGPGNYSFLSWTGANDVPTLANSLTPPGDFETWTHPDDDADTTPDPNDWIQGGPGVNNARAVRDALDLLIGEDITVVEWSQTRGQGSNFDYQIARLIVIELTEYKLNGQGYFSWIYKGTSNCAVGNQPPVAEDQFLVTDEDAALPITLTAADADGDALTYSIDSLPTSGVLTGTAPELIYMPNPNVSGTDTFTFTVSDGELVSNPATVTITINPINDAPTADDKSATLDEDTSAVIVVSGSDIDGDALSFSVAQAPQFGTVTIVGNQATYVPNAHYHGVDQFTYVANDGVASSQPAVVSLLIVPVNDAPIALDRNVTTPEDTAVAIGLVGQDIDGDALSYSTVSSPDNGALSVVGNSVTYTPNPDFSGSDSFTYIVNDGSVDSAPATVFIDVIPVNDPPVADSQSVETPEDTALAILLTGSDPENDALVFSVLAGPDSGSLSGSPPDLIYTPDENFTGIDAFTFFTNDSDANSDPASISITVTPVNDAPVADPQSVSVDEDSVITFELTGSDIENDALSFALLDVPQHGAITLDGSTVTYTPSENYNGEDSLTFMTNDGDLDSAPAVVGISVLPVNDPPTIDPLPDAERVEGQAFSATATASDIDGDPLTFSAEGLPAALTIEAATGVISGLAQTVGTHVITISVSDPDGASASTAFTLLITPANVAPVANDQSLTVEAGVATPVALTGSDEDGDALVYRIIEGPVSGTLTGDAPDLVYTSNETFEGLDSFTFDVNDGTLDSNVATVTIEVMVPNRPPEIVSTPVTRGAESAVYAYDVDAVDPDLDVLAYSSDAETLGLTIDPQSGVLTGLLTNVPVSSVRSQNIVCRKPVRPIDFEIETAWQWLSPNADSGHEVFGPVTVGQLSDDNGDGLIDKNDVPDGVFFSRREDRSQGYINVVSGLDGEPIWSNNSLPYAALSSASLGDLDGDGIVEIALVTFDRAEVAVLEHDGSLKWRSPAGPSSTAGNRVPRDAPVVADINSDGNPEVINGRTVYNGQTGSIMWTGTADSGGSRSYGYLPIVADIDLNGTQNLVAGRTVYESDGTILWHRSDLPGDGYTAVANLDQDDEAEIILVTSGRVFALDSDGTGIWGRTIPDGGTGGAPTVADFDGDGSAEIATVGRSKFVVYDTDGTILWSNDVEDISSNQTGSSLFDFDGDGRPEIVYADEINLYIWDAATGELRYSEPNFSGTVLEYPVIADIDNDGEAEILLGSSGDGRGLRALQSAGDAWMPTRSIWNQHAYSITNVNDDGTIPAYPAPSWLTHNTYRLNTFVDRNPLDEADLALFDITLDEVLGTVSVTAVNRGLAPAEGPIVVELVDAGQIIAQWVLDALAASEEVLLSEAVDVASLSDTLAGRIDTSDAVSECIEDNNTTGAAVIRVRATDPEGLFDTQTFSVVVDNVNDAPVILTESLPEGVVGQAYSVFIEAADPDVGDALRFTLLDAPAGMQLDEITGELRWFDEDVLEGSFPVVVEVQDLAGESDTRSLTLESIRPNNPPVADDQSVEVLTATPTPIELTGSDNDGDTLTFTVVDGPSHGTLFGTPPSLTYTSDAEFEGTDFFTYVANDGQDDSPLARVDIIVSIPNRAPAIVSDPTVSVDEFAVYMYDVDAVDPDAGDVIEYGLDVGPAGMSIESATGFLEWNATAAFDNSLRVPNSQCRATPQTGTLAIAERWHWAGASIDPSINQVYGPVTVVQLSDDNADGLITTQDVPDVVFYAGREGEIPGYLVAVSGRTGEELWIDDSLEYGRWGSLAAGDLDGDGIVELVSVLHQRAEIAVIEHDGTLKYTASTGPSHTGPQRRPRDGASLADIDGDGLADIVLGNRAYRGQDGTELWRGTDDLGGQRQYGLLSIVADVDLDGLPNVVAGRTLYDHLGNTVWHRGDLPADGYAAVGNLDADDEAEIVLISNGRVYVLNHDGSTVWGGPTLPGGGVGGPPTIADLDGDGLAEITTAGATFITAYETDGQVKWSTPTQDESSNRTGSSVFDFDGDGRVEVVYADEVNLYVMDGETGTILIQVPNSSRTHLEYPVIADIDNDGGAEILMGGNEGANFGLRAFGSATGSWMPTRGIWNQHAYAITNVNEDGTIPANPTPSWLSHNTFRLNTFPDRSPLDRPDLAAFDVAVDDESGEATVIVTNRGLAPAFGPFVVSLENNGAMIATWNVDVLAEGASVPLSAPVDAELLGTMLTVAVDAQNTVAECIEDNNVAYAEMIRVSATDTEGALDRQTFALFVENVNEAPTFATGSLPPGIAGQPYAALVEALDPDRGDAMAFSIVDGPVGLSVNELTGEITWPLVEVQAGTYTIQVRVDDLSGLSATQTYSLEVDPANSPPVASNLELTTQQDTSLELTLSAFDPNGDTLAYAIVNPPNHGSLAGVAPNLEYLPEAGYIGSDTFTYVANDGLVDSNTATVTISVFAPNTAPTITSTPVTTVEEGIAYSYAVTATDADGDTLSYALTQFPSGMSIDGAGVISWTPNSAQVGDNAVTVEVSDGRGGLDSQPFVVTVTEAQANRGPQVTSVPATFTKEGREYSYQMVATDPDGDALNYTLINGPTGMAVDTAGLLTWTVVAEGEYPVTLRVDDAQAFVDQDWTLTVLPASTFDIYVAVDPVPLAGEPFTVTVTPINAAGPVVGAIDVAGQILMLDDELQVTVTVDTPGDYTLSLTVSDDLDTIERDQPLSVLEALDPTAPTVTLATPDYDQIVTAPIDVIGSVQDTDLASWTLFAVEKGTTDAFILAEGTEPFAEQVIAQFDPTMLLNGMYTIELQATDTSANQAFDNRQVIVDGNMKVGNFSITFEDMTVPVSGIPITVTRTYDTRQSHKNMDFGYGWSVDYDNVRVHESRPLGLSWDLVQFDRGFFTDWCVLANGNPVVTVTLPDGEVEKFQAKAQPECSPQQPEVNVQIVFEPIDGTDTVLEAPQLGLQKLVNGNLVDPGDFTVSADPQFYRLTTPEGYIYELNQGFTVNQVIDPNGNTLTFTEDGIVHSSGENLEFVRDTQGRISQIIAPDGTTTNYDYTVEGDLERFRDQLDHGTEFAYLAQRAHYLEDIIDPRGIRVARNEYDDDGRLVAHIDADGNRIEYTHDIEGRQELIKDRRGNTMLYVYDDQGNVIAETNALNETTLREYDNDYNETAMVDPLGNRTEWTYDNRRNQTSETNALDEVTTSTYNGRNALLTQVDDAGITVISNVYSSQNGELRSTTDALSNTTQFVYDSGIGSNATGELKSMTDAENNSMQYFINPITGRRDGEIDARGTSTSYFYDAMGRVERQVTNRTDALGSTVTLETSFVFDDKGNVTQTTHPDGSITRTEYNEIDKPIAEIDANGNRTEMEYDDRGNLALTRYADGSTETTEYDEEGNTIAQTDRAGRTTRMVYDAAGRMVETIYPDDTPLDESDNPRMINEYDVAGRLEATVNERGFRTEYEYDAIGRRTLVRDALGNETAFEYNNRGHRTATVDARGKRTEFTYDDAGRLLRTTFHDGTFTETAYDGLGRKVSETDQAGLTTQFEYDEGGNLTAVVDALSQRTEYVYDEQSNKTIQRDAEGRETRWEYDDLGRVIARVLPEGQRESFTYDDAGNRISRTDFNGVTTSYTYDNLNRMTRTDYPDGTFVRTVYDVTGQVDFMEDHRGMTDYTYDVRDRLQRIDYPNGTYVEYGYDIAGNRIRLTTPNQQVIYTYDELNRLETVTDATGVATYGYDAVGNRDFTDYANGTRAEYVYDDLNRLLQLTNYDALGGIMTDHVYTLGNAGNRTQMAETLPTGARVVDYVYDDLYRLVEEQVTDSVHGDQITTWTYDQVGNRQTQTVDDGSIVTTTYTYDDNDRLLTEVGTDSINYRYDANGNTLDKAVNGLVEVIYEYDYENRLIATDNATYAYDPSGIRQSKVENGQGVIYLVDPNRDYAQVIEEQDAMGQAQVIYSYGDDLLTQTRSEGTYQYHYDGLGSTRALSDVFGAESDSYIYSAFGELEEQAGTTPNSYLYTGEQFDPNLGWYYLRARYYNPSNGRFPTMDTWMGRMNVPISLHKYLYVHASPVNGVDPSGLFMDTNGLLVAQNVSAGLKVSAVARVGVALLFALASFDADSPTLKTRRAATRLELDAAKARVRQCVKTRSKNCKTGIPVIVFGADAKEQTTHIEEALFGKGLTPVLSKIAHPGHGRAWMRPFCQGTPSMHCDEYPFNITAEGGPANPVSIKKIPCGPNCGGGSRLRWFFQKCGVTDTDPYRKWFGVVALEEAPITTGWNEDGRCYTFGQK